MTTQDDLDTLAFWEGFPAEHRLRVCLEAHLAGDDHPEKVKALAKALGYSHPAAVELWVSLSSRIPIRHLPGIANFLGIGLPVLLSYWVAEEARTDALAMQLFEAAKPRVTDAELELIEMCRAVYSHDDDRDEILPPG